MKREFGQVINTLREEPQSAPDIVRQQIKYRLYFFLGCKLVGDLETQSAYRRMAGETVSKVNKSWAINL